MPKFKDLTGQIFGRLTVVRLDSMRRGAYWLCSCSCGGEKVIPAASLKSAGTRSCGCLRKEASAGRAATLFKKHGGSSLSEYKIWKLMRARCNNHKLEDYKNYGGRGIKVCKRWESFENFIADMGLRPGPEFSIERINNDAGYGPDNCKWATRKEQANNKRNLRKFTFMGETLSLTAWARRAGINPMTLWSRIESGCTIEQAILAKKNSKRMNRAILG